MSKERLPKTDSIEELAQFWDTHDLTDFEDELEEVPGPVFSHDMTVTLRLPANDAAAVRKMAHSKGLAEAELIRSWVLEKLHAS
ncbi:MAG: BrnA antitoxin family protein [Planctomycetes bacterium]|nr:BrnA antitoxin family protein [Planctomycetota bacterium]